MPSGSNTAAAHQMPPGQSPPSSTASPSSSSSAVSAPNQLGFELMQQRRQQQQQLAYRQALQAQQQNHHQQPQLKKAESELSHLPYQVGGTYGVSGAGFPANSAVQSSQLLKKYGNILCQPGALQLREESDNKVLGTGQEMQNSIHQAYLQFALQSARKKSHGNFVSQQQGKTNMVGQSGRDQDMIMNKLKMHELMSQASGKSQMPMFKRAVEQFTNAEKQMEQGHINHDQRNDLKPFPAEEHLSSANMIRPVQSLQPQGNVRNFTSNQLEMAQMQAMQAWAMEHNVDLSVPANLNLIAQILPLLQSNKVAAGQKPTETSVSIQQSLPTSKQQVMQSPAGSDCSAHGNSTSDLTGQRSSLKLCQTLPLSSNRAGDTTSINTSTFNMKQQQVAENSSRVSQNERVAQTPMLSCSGAQDTNLANLSGSINQTQEKSNYNSISVGNKMQTQSFRPLLQVNHPVPLLATPANNSADAQIPTGTGSALTPKQYFGFTKKQLHVLKAQILAFRRLKRGERSLPPEVLQAIADSTSDHQPSHGPHQSENVNYDLTKADNSSNHEHRMIMESNNQTQKSAPATKRHTQMKEEPFSGEEKTAFASQMQVSVDLEKDPGHADSIGRLEESNSVVKSEQESEKGSQNSSSKVNCHANKGKVTHMDSGDSMVPRHPKTPAQTNTTTPLRDGVSKKYHGPIFDFLSFTRKPDTLGSTSTIYSSNLTLAYNVKDLLYEEGKFVLTKKRAENLKKIGWLLAFNLERKIINPDIVVQLQIEEKKLKLFDLQARLRDEVEHQQEEIMAMSDIQYRKFVRQCEQQRVELARQVQQLQRALRDKLLKTVFQWRKKLLESHWAIYDARTTRNRGIAKYHERMLREFSKRMDEDKNKRMDALKNNDADRYCEMLLEQQTSIQGDAAQRYAVVSSFLTQTEEYLHKLGGKITAAKSSQEVEEAANAAVAAARAQGLSSEEVIAAAACTREEVMIRNRFSEMNAQNDSSVIRHYNLTHAVIERVVSQPSMLRAGTLRDYQLVGLQWMLSLYNNKLNGILADEMGLGKTIQVMALIAYLMEFKGNYGPHLIVVPNAVLVNWKNELLNWLPSISCIFYVGGKDERSKLFSQEICAVKFNVLVTTYEFIMYDCSKLSKIDWKYIIIDEAQRMKDRESVLACNLDRYRCQRRLLLTGTPLQNDLKELWSLLNLLLPEVFDNHKVFHDWFSKPFQKDGPHNEEEDEWLETEKKVIIIHRLHQILEPFMLRRHLEDVESSLPQKISIVVRCRMSAIQGAIYDWIKATGTIRADHEDETRGVQKNPLYQVKTYNNLNNKCLELRKVCNHPLLSYPYLSNYSKDFIVRSCGKLWVLDRILIKLQRAGHRVLLFSTMTKLLDILEEYLQWRRLIYRRIDGTTCLEDRESAIVDFNSPDSECFIFLLSIRAAGRGLHLQTADTVVIYDPDPNPQNEEQAIVRAHRIGQKSEVKVIYMEAVVDKISSYQKEDELSNGVAGNSDDDLAGKDRYMGSIESLIRNNIQQCKIDMADEVINAGCFDQRTTHEERRMTLEMLLHDEERYQEKVHDVPSMQEVNRMIARSEEEVELFDQMDEDLDWTADMVKHSELPKWLRVSSRELDAATTSLSKKPLNTLSGNIVSDPSAAVSDPSLSKMERRGGRPRKQYPIYQELDDEDGEDSDIDSEERNASEEEREVGEFNDEGFIDVVDVLSSHKIQVTQEMGREKGGYEFSQTMIHHSTNSSSGSCRLLQHKNPVLSSQKFGSLSLLDARPSLPSKKSEELEEGEIAVSGDSHLDLQQSGSWLHDHEDGEEDQQVLQPKITRKRSIRIRPRYNVEKNGKNTDIAKVTECASRWLQVGDEYAMPSRTGKLESFSHADLGKHHTTSSSWKHKHDTVSRKISPMRTSGRLSYFSGSAEDGNKHSRDIWHNRANKSGGPIQMGAKMSDITQRKCKNVISKLQMRIHKDGTQIVPNLYDWWRKNERSSFATNATGGKLLDLQIIEQRVDNLQYSGVTEFITDVQLMLKSVVRRCNYSYEVKCEAERLQALFFNIMKIAFPHSDFQQARNAVSFSNPGRAATSPGGPSQKLTDKIKQRTPILAPKRTSSHVATHTNDEGRAKSSTPSKRRKELRLVSGSWTEKTPECSLYLPPHPGDLVVCKKRRKERDKSSVNQRIVPTSLSKPSRMSSGPSSSINRNSNFSILRNSNSANQAKHASSLPPREMQQPDDKLGASRSIADIHWVKPVKRMRTDSCKRRPSHM